MASSEPKSAGIIESVKRVGETSLALLQNRLQLFSVELQEEKYRAIQVALWLFVGVVFLFLGMAIGIATVAILVLAQWGLPGLAGLTLLLLAIGAVVIALMWSRLKSGRLPFAGTLQELKKDSEWLRRKH